MSQRFGMSAWRSSTVFQPSWLGPSRRSEDRKLQHVVGPVLEHIARYFVSPIDLIPEMTYGLAGLLDDAYLVLRILKNLDRGSEPFLDWDLDEPLAFLRGSLGQGDGRETGSHGDAGHERRR